MIRLGGQAFPVKSDDPYAFARAHTAFGYGAAYCPPVDLGDTARIADIRKAFAAENIMIAEVGIWRNLITPDDATRKANRDLCGGASRGRRRGRRRCAVGSSARVRRLRPCAAPEEPDAGGVRRLRRDGAGADRRGEAEAREVCAGNDAIQPAGQRRRLRRADPRRGPPAFAAHLDPVNLILTPRQYWETAR